MRTNARLDDVDARGTRRREISELRWSWQLRQLLSSARLPPPRARRAGDARQPVLLLASLSVPVPAPTSPVAPHAVAAALRRRLGRAEPAAALQVLLVVLLGGPKDRRRPDLGHHLAAAGSGLRVRDRRLCHPALLVRVVVDPVSVLRAVVVAHPVHGGRVERREQRLADGRVREDLWVIDELHRLGVARASAAHVVVRGLSRAPLRVPDAGRDDAIKPLQSELNSPETAARYCGHLEAVGRGRRHLIPQRKLSRFPAPRLYRAVPAPAELFIVDTASGHRGRRPHSGGRRRTETPDAEQAPEAAEALHVYKVPSEKIDNVMATQDACHGHAPRGEEGGQACSGGGAQGDCA
mmetsp:Transcript_35313/g.112913  ORF Transcript_35313/g.112913 Transcript_35313/m.112913 type:complete len:352 (+) Transcript_35313:48-1103(+)